MPRKTRMYLRDIPGAYGTARKQPGCVLFPRRRVPFPSGRLSERQGRFGVALHACVLMTNHVHLLMTPRDTAGISRLMQHLGRHYVLHLNRQYRRTDTLWEDRHKASLCKRTNIA